MSLRKWMKMKHSELKYHEILLLYNGTVPLSYYYTADTRVISALHNEDDPYHTKIHAKKTHSKKTHNKKSHTKKNSTRELHQRKFEPSTHATSFAEPIRRAYS
ncbi:hypothetical protein CONLIGDRAFT_648721 [Coniochaeta ligniaria NRRL 30616]|uniref:Uncharacterized protein n=1 Tax=Coniochaeta ligniaria NRRL 30616 TaxID=1408157 RepID=A0A1J7J439_9PEZI|nr:hypothetical protein CONLIGDRAFT_648721 [Coniochaeta ligniaria NRRL 30616]